MALDDAAWAEIRRLYCDTTITVREITDAFVLPLASSMPAACPRAGLSAPTCPPTMPGAFPTPPAGPTRREALVNRLYAAIDEKLERLEKRMKSGEASTVADSERETRELSQ